MTFKNVGKKPVKILLSMPQNSCFSIPFPEPIIIPTGLSVCVNVTFTPTIEREERSTLRVFLPDIEESFVINLLAKLSILSIKLPELIDFGYVGVGETNIHSFNVINDGDVEYKFRVEAPSPYQILNPKNKCKPGETISIQCSCTPSAAGLMEGSFVVTIKDNAEKYVVPVKIVAKFPNLVLSITDHRYDGKLITYHDELEFAENSKMDIPKLGIPGVVQSKYSQDEFESDHKRYIKGYHELLHLKNVMIGTQLTTTFRIENSGQVRTTFSINDSWSKRRKDLYVIGPSDDDNNVESPFPKDLGINSELDKTGKNDRVSEKVKEYDKTFKDAPPFLKVFPRNGELMPGDYTDITVVFSAHTPDILVNEELEIVTTGGVTRYVTIKGYSASPKCNVDKNIIAFGYVQGGKRQRTTIVLKNDSSVPCFYQISAASPVSSQLQSNRQDEELSSKPSPFLSPLRSVYNVPDSPFKIFPSYGVIPGKIAKILTVEFSPNPYMAMLPTSMLFMIMIAGGDPIPMFVTGSPVPIDRSDKKVMGLMKSSVLGDINEEKMGSVDKILDLSEQISISNAQPRPAPSCPEYAVIADAMRQAVPYSDLVEPLDPMKVGGRIPHDSFLYNSNLPEFSANEDWSGDEKVLCDRTLFLLKRLVSDSDRVISSRTKFERVASKIVSQADREFVIQRIRSFLSISNILSYEFCGDFGSSIDEPNIFLSRNAIDFGFVSFTGSGDSSQTRTESIEITNLGDISYKIVLTMTPGAYSQHVFGTKTDFVIVPPHSKKVIEFSFKPTRSGGEFGAVVELLSTPSQIVAYQALINCVVPASTVHRINLIGRSFIDDSTPEMNVPTYACSVSFTSTPNMVVLKPVPIGSISHLTIPIRNNGDQPLSYKFQYFDPNANSWKFCESYFSPSCVINNNDGENSDFSNTIRDRNTTKILRDVKTKQGYGSSLAINPLCGLIPPKSTQLIMVIGIPYKQGRWLYRLRVLFGGCYASVNVQSLDVFITGETPSIMIERTIDESNILSSTAQNDYDEKIYELGFGAVDEAVYGDDNEGNYLGDSAEEDKVLSIPNKVLDLEANESILTSERPAATFVLPSVSLDSSISTVLTLRSTSNCLWFLILLPPASGNLMFHPNCLTLKPHDTASTTIRLDVPSSDFNIGDYSRIVTAIAVSGRYEIVLPRMVARYLNINIDSFQEFQYGDIISEVKYSSGYCSSLGILRLMIRRNYDLNKDENIDYFQSRIKGSFLGRLSYRNCAGLRICTSILSKELEISPNVIDGMSLIVGKKHHFMLKLKNNTSTYIGIQLFIEKPKVIKDDETKVFSDEEESEIARASLNLDISSLPLMNESEEGLQIPPNTEINLELTIRVLRRGRFSLRFGAILDSLSPFSKRVTRRSLREIRKTQGSSMGKPGRILGRNVTEALQIEDIEKEDISLQRGGVTMSTLNGCGALPRIQISSITSPTTSILDLVDSIDIEGLNKYLDGQITEVEQEIRKRAGVLITQDGTNLMNDLKVFPVALGPSVPRGLSPDTDIFTHYTLTLTNPTNVPVKISLSLPSERSPTLSTAPWAHQVPTNEDEKMKELIANEIFAIWPRDYVIQPNKSEFLNIRYRHLRPGIDIMKVLLDIESGKMVVLELHGQTLHKREPALISPSVVQLLPALVGHKYIAPIQYIKLRNPSNIKCGYVIDTSELVEINRHLGLIGKPAIVLSNPSGTVDRFSELHLRLTFQPSVSDMFELSLPLYLIPLGKNSKLHSRASIHSSIGKTDSPEHLFVPKIKPKRGSNKKHIEPRLLFTVSQSYEKQSNNEIEEDDLQDQNKEEPRTIGSLISMRKKQIKGKSGVKQYNEKDEDGDTEEEMGKSYNFRIPDDTEPYLTIVLRGGGLMCNTFSPIPLSLIPEYYTVSSHLNNTLLHSGTYPICHLASLDTSLVTLGCLPTLCHTMFNVKMTSRSDVDIMFNVDIPSSFRSGIYGNLSVNPSRGILKSNTSVVFEFTLSSLLPNGDILVSPYVSAVDEIRIDLAHITEDGTYIQKQAETKAKPNPAYIAPDVLKSVSLMSTFSSKQKINEGVLDKTRTTGSNVLGKTEKVTAGVGFSERRIFAIREGILLPKLNDSNNCNRTEKGDNSSNDGPLTPPSDYFSKKPISKSNIHMDSLSFVLCFYRADTEYMKKTLTQYEGLPEVFYPYYPTIPLKSVAFKRHIVETCSSSTARDWMGKTEQNIVTGVIGSNDHKRDCPSDIAEILFNSTSYVQEAIMSVFKDDDGDDGASVGN